MTIPIYVCSIAKNEGKHVRRWAESAKNADRIYLLDTGSTDDTVKIAKECGVTVFEKTYDKWSFSVARNDLREMLPDHDAWLINLDLDEVLCEGWHEALKKVPLEFNRPRYEYDWSWLNPVFTEDGQYDIEATRATSGVGLSYRGDKIVRRHSHYWVNKVHEINITAPGHEEMQYYCEGLRIQHFADHRKPRSSYLPLLLEDVEENPENDRNTYYAARELMYHGRTEESVKLFKRHITMASSWWPPERGFSMRYIAKQLPGEREWWLLRGCAEYPWGREIWLDLAQHYHDEKNWNGCYWAAWRCLQVRDRGNLYLTEAHAWGWAPHDLMALSAYRLGMFDVAIEQGKKALEHAPNDQRLKDNLFFYKNAHSNVTVVIPTKSNFSGLMLAVNDCMKSSKVKRIVVVADGENAYKNLDALPSSVIKLMVPEGVGIHKMWNLGLSLADSHVLFLNDDVELELGAIDAMCASLDKNPNYALVCPQYEGPFQKQMGAHAQYKQNPQHDVFTTTTCRGRYDGTGGMAGFCMMLASDMAKDWRFDERMMWYWGDDDIVAHVASKGRLSAIISSARCYHDHSRTIENDTPKNFAAIVEQDKKIYEMKRGINAHGS